MFQPLYWAIIRSHSISKETIQCGIYICNIIKRDLVVNMAIDHCRGGKNIFIYFSCILTLLLAPS
jgi:hypothetical protein